VGNLTKLTTFWDFDDLSLYSKTMNWIMLKMIENG